MALSVNFVLETISNHLGERKFGAFGTRAFDVPFTIVIDHTHFAARPPPIIDFAWQGEPGSFFLTLLAQETPTDPDRYLAPSFR